MMAKAAEVSGNGLGGNRAPYFRPENLKKRIRAEMDATVSFPLSTTRARVHARLGLPVRGGRFATKKRIEVNV